MSFIRSASGAAVFVAVSWPGLSAHAEIEVEAPQALADVVVTATATPGRFGQRRQASRWWISRPCRVDLFRI